MDDLDLKRPKGRTFVYHTDEERKEALKRSKTKYMKNKEWYCEICNNGINYKLNGKWSHLKTKKHSDNKETLKKL